MHGRMGAPGTDVKYSGRSGGTLHNFKRPKQCPRNVIKLRGGCAGRGGLQRAAFRCGGGRGRRRRSAVARSQKSSPIPHRNSNEGGAPTGGLQRAAQPHCESPQPSPLRRSLHPRLHPHSKAVASEAVATASSRNFLIIQ